MENSKKELEEKIIEQIKDIYDPEIPVNIYDLGLIYDVAVTEDNDVVVLMTLTAPGCPEAGVIPGEVEIRVKELPEVKNVKVILTFDPPWEQSMLSDAAKLELGLF